MSASRPQKSTVESFAPQPLGGMDQPVNSVKAIKQKQGEESFGSAKLSNTASLKDK